MIADGEQNTDSKEDKFKHVNRSGSLHETAVLLQQYLSKKKSVGTEIKPNELYFTKLRILRF